MTFDEQLKAKRKMREELEIELQRKKEYENKIKQIEEENRKIREIRKQTSLLWRKIYAIKELPSNIKRAIRGY